jgi:enoyl-CoA hydratase/carnithine racemase
MKKDTPKFSFSMEGHVANIELCNGQYNYISTALVRDIADLLQELDSDDQCRAIVLSAQGRAFCAGYDFGSQEDESPAGDPGPFYAQAMRLFDFRKPVVAAVHGPAIGAGLGLALTADFRVTCKEARFSANFNRLGFHPGFGMSMTLPRLVGIQQAALLFYTGRRIDGADASRIGLADVLVDVAEVRRQAFELAEEIASSAPIAVEATRATLRHELASEVRQVNQLELELQRLHFRSEDFREGIAAMAERRLPVFLKR